MKRTILIGLMLLICTSAKLQTVKDLFNPSEQKITWLGIDFRHVKLIGDFAQFAEAGSTSANDIRDIYFSAWNKLIINERDKYDLKGMLRKSEIFYEIDYFMEINSKASLEDMETYNDPDYSEEDITGFVNEYELEFNEGIGIFLVAESLNKSAQEAYYHFVAINMATKEILMQRRLKGRPQGFGMRNYWAGSVYSVIKAIKSSHYRKWKKAYG